LFGATSCLHDGGLLDMVNLCSNREVK